MVDVFEVIKAGIPPRKLCVIDTPEAVDDAWIKSVAKQQKVVYAVGLWLPKYGKLYFARHGNIMMNFRRTFADYLNVKLI